MKIGRLCLVTAALLILTACGVQYVATSDVMRSDSQPPQTQAPVSQQVLDSKAAFLEQLPQSPSPLNYYFLYVTGSNGNPVANLKCFTTDNWAQYQAEGWGRTNGLSMTNGLLPFYLTQYETPDSQTELKLVLVNMDAEDLPAQMFIFSQAEFEQLKNGEILPVNWEGALPKDTILKEQEAVSIYLTSPTGEPVSNALVMLELPRPDVMRPSIGGDPADLPEIVIRNDPRYTDETGFVRLSTKALNAIAAEQGIPLSHYRILIRRSILTQAEEQMMEYLLPAEQDGQPMKEYHLTLTQDLKG